MQPISVEQSRTMPLAVEDAFDRVLVAPLPVIFKRRHMVLPPIKEVRDQEGEWGTVGQTRTIATTDGGTIHEELTAVERPSLFGYRITEIRGPMKPLVASIDGAWRFEADGDGTKVTWAWTLHPTSKFTRPTVALVGKFWAGYAKKALAEAEKAVAA